MIANRREKVNWQDAATGVRFRQGVDLRGDLSVWSDGITMSRMAKRHKQTVERYHDRVAGNYDHSYDDAYWRWHDALTWDHIKAFLPRDQSAPVVDLGCGTGKWAARLAKSGFSVTCVDISNSMLDRARRKLAGSSDGRSTFLRADLCDLSDLPVGCFSLALAMGEPICSAESPLKALKEIRRTLQPDGVLVATFDNRLNAIEFELRKGKPASMEEFLRNGRTQWITHDREERFDLHTYTPTQLGKLLENAGYRVVDMIGKTVLPMRDHRRLLEDPSDRRAWMKIEKTLWRDPAAMGRAAHLQCVATPC